MSYAPHQYLTEVQVSEITGIAVKTLQNHRWKGVGIPYVKKGHMVRYLCLDVIRYMESGRASRSPNELILPWKDDRYAV